MESSSPARRNSAARDKGTVKQGKRKEIEMYHDYILGHMSHGRIEDARRQAAADRICRQKAQRKDERQKGISLQGFIGALAKLVKGHPAPV
jgi:hypothetical protein